MVKPFLKKLQFPIETKKQKAAAMKKLWILCFLFLIPISVYADSSWFSENTRIYSNSKLSLFADTTQLQNIAFFNYQDGDSFTLDIIVHIKNDHEWNKLMNNTKRNIKKNPASYVMVGDLDQAKYLKREMEFDFIQNKATILKEYFIDDDNNIMVWRSLTEEHDLIEDQLWSKVAQNMKAIFEVLLSNPS
jgi:hypothetical protein